jgi:hypothetical protein
MRATRLLPAAVVASCLAALPAPAAAEYFDVGRLPAPPVTGKEIADSIASFSSGHAHRVTGTPSELLAGEDIAAQARQLGYEVEVVPLTPQGTAPGTSPLKVVVATRRGTTKPDEHIVFGAHYDNVPQTVDGAYDNGSGTMMLLALAKSFASVPTKRTLVFAWYNGEEEGTQASQPHAKMFKDDGKKVRAMLGFDMVGIAWPVANRGATNCLCMWHGDEDDAFAALLKYVNYDVLRFPSTPNAVEVRGNNVRNSDEASWDVQGYPTLRWAGMRSASNYPAYHMPDDTMETIDEVAGGRIFFEQGLRNTLLSSYYTVLALDNELPTAAATATGTRPVTFDASGSTDPDGPVGDVVWDFGDGTTGSGARVTHEYASSGVYTATASVADSHWPQVRRTATVTVQAEGAPAVAVPPAPLPGATPQPETGTKKAAKKKRRCRTVKRKARNKQGKRVTKKVRVCTKAKKKSRRSAKRRSARKRGR